MESNNESQTPSPPAKQIVVAPVPDFSPWAASFPPKKRATAIELISCLNPDRAESKTLQVAKDAALDLIETFDAEFDGMEVKLECTGMSARQILVIVIPHKL